MEIITLSLRNFKGIQSFTLDAQGRDAVVYGDNATGKTTLYDAFLWLLFDKDSQNRKDFQIKTLGSDGEPRHGLEHEVEAVLDLGNRQVTLRKVYQEKWTKRRGQAQREFSGHTTDHYIDGVPVRKAEYDALIASIADEQRFRLLTDPTFFNVHLHWQERRKLLLEICGDVMDEEVIASDAELAALPAILNGRSLEDHRKVIQARRAEINRELDRIPVRIDEVQRALPDVSELNETALRAQLADLRTKRQALQEERARITAGGEIAEQTKRLRETEAELLAIELKLRAVAEEAVAEDRATLGQANADIDAKRREISRARAEAADAAAEAERVSKRMEALRQRWYEVDGTAFEHTSESVCPTCGQALPEDRIQEAREKALAEFNARKARELEEISAEGRRFKARLEELQEIQKSRQAMIAQAEEALATITDIAATAQARIDEARTKVPDPTNNPEHKRLRAEKAQVEATIANLRDGATAALAAVTEKARIIDDQIAEVEAALSHIEQGQRGMKRIEELRDEERCLAAEFEELERQLHLTDLFVRSKVRLLTDRINSRFELAHFKLFDVQVNGGISETCETTYQGVPYQSLNHGARLNVGLDIINTLAEHYGFAPVVWVDNAESVTNILPTRGQQIRLVVSAGDKSLRVECEPVNLAKRMEVA
ncbi:MAG: hypothetical protein AB7E55_01310 [Pigmentiphaga sp.]